MEEAREADLMEQLRALLQRRAVMRGAFVLSSSASSDYYLDARVVTLSCDGAPLVARAFLTALQPAGADAVAGLAVGADPIVSAIATYSTLCGQRLHGLIIRKEAKEHGTARRIEGPWSHGMRVAVVDDTLTSGGSALRAAEAIETAGGSVVGVYALIDREQGAREAITAAGYPFFALFTGAELLQI